MKQIVNSFSGGRSSATNTMLLINKFGKENVKHLYLDTGAEHPKTYEFIRNVVKQLDIELTCLRPIVRGGRKSSDYKIVSVDEIGCDMIPITEVMGKYGKPSFKAASCTREMKKTLADKWRKDNFGKDGSEMWLGIRYDEPARLVGKDCYSELFGLGYDKIEIAELFRAWANKGPVDMAELFFDGAKNRVAFKNLFNYLYDRDKSDNLHYMAEISEFEKKDVLDYWSRMSFDLEIKEHLGNCVFCVKKSINKIALAIRDEPELFEQWNVALSNANTREDLPKIHELQKAGIIYRGNHNLDSIIKKFEHLSRDELLMTIRSMRVNKEDEDGGCSESCEAY